MDNQIAQQRPASNPPSALESLCVTANEIVANYSGTRRPSWAPALCLEGELVSVLRTLEWLKPKDKDVARLWARFTDPQQGPVSCVGFELRAGQTRSGKRFFETYRRVKTGEWRSGPTWLLPKDPENKWAKRFPMLERATELGARRVAEFAESPHEQMMLGGVYTSTCCICGRTIHDPISLERGIGPECWAQHQGGRRIGRHHGPELAMEML
jgi:hypothetical protein